MNLTNTDLEAALKENSNFLKPGDIYLESVAPDNWVTVTQEFVFTKSFPDDNILRGTRILAHIFIMDDMFESELHGERDVPYLFL